MPYAKNKKMGISPTCMKVIPEDIIFKFVTDILFLVIE